MVNEYKKLHLEILHVISVCKSMQEYAEMLIYKYLYTQKDTIKFID